jgi:hypothetical protein
LDLRADGTFTKSEASASDNISLDMMGVAFIAPSGKWALEGSDLRISFGSAAEGHSMLLRVVSLSRGNLVLRFGDHGSVEFTRKDITTR